MPQVFDAEDFLDVPEDGDSTQGKVKKDEPVAPEPKKPEDIRVPDDFADVSLRGKSLSELAGELARAQADAAAARKLATDTSATVAAALARDGGDRDDTPPDYTITEEDLLGNNAAALNAKLDKLVAAKAAPLLLESYQNLSQQAFAVARGDTQNMPFFQEYEGEILALAAKTHVGLTARLGTWYELYNKVTSSHQAEITEKIVRKRLEAERANGRPAPDSERGRASTVVANGKVELDDRQKAVARALGVSFEDYAKNLERMG